MSKPKNLDKVAINIKSYNILKNILSENPRLKKILIKSENDTEVLVAIKDWILPLLEKRTYAFRYYNEIEKGREIYEKLSWSDFALIRILDYIDNTGRELEDPNLRNYNSTVNNPFKMLWLAAKFGTGGAKPPFFQDMFYLFRQLSGTFKRELPTQDKVIKWMDRHPSGLDSKIIKIRQNNKDRIINAIIKKIDKGEINDKIYHFEEGTSYEQKYLRVREWWNERLFHLRFAVRTPKMLNDYLGRSLSPKIMRILNNAEDAGIPFFVNPYYLSLINPYMQEFDAGADLPIRDYVLYSRELIEEFGKICAWEKEDIVEPGKPNAAGWLLPSYHNVHRRYPEVAILIPDTVGRACAGLCASCQRMFDFQNGHLNFNLKKLQPKETWPQKLLRLLEYFEEDSQLRDILITGGDALMSSDASLKNILDEVYNMAVRKIEANKNRKDGEKLAEMLRIRLGTRLPVYLPQRITNDLVNILKEFKDKALKIGIRQFVIQTHFESAMEVTPEVKKGIELLRSAGWTITNQYVFTAAGSRRGHTVKLRKVLNDLGIINYYTFTVKGFRENSRNFATNERAVQEQIEEKIIGEIPEKYYDTIKTFQENPLDIVKNVDKLRKEAKIPFLATDRNVLNLPGVGKSLTYRVVGITRYGRRILEFDHDINRPHSPITKKMGKITIIEAKSIFDYLRQLEAMGEDTNEYLSIYGYSIGETEPIMPIYKYPEYDFKITDEYTNLEIN